MKRNVDPSQITEDTPLRLATAAELAFPDGGMGASGLRREAARGRLVVERIAGKDFTTLADIAMMRELCRLQPREPVSGSAKQSRSALDAALTNARRLSKGLQPIAADKAKKA